jgi:site-specific DNA recombinase
MWEIFKRSAARLTFQCISDSARYSSDLQSPASIEDQKRKCREYATGEGFVEVRSYEDIAVSGSGMDRLGLKRLIADATNSVRDFDVILVDDTSRLSRSLRYRPS